MSMTGSQKLLALIWLFLVLISTSAQSLDRSASASAATKTNAPIILTATVLDQRGRAVTGLTKENFEVVLDKLPVPITSCDTWDTPLSVGIVFDASASTGIPGSPKANRLMISELQRALAGFMAMSNRANEYFLLGFNTKPQLLVDWTTDQWAIVDALSVVQPKGITAFYDACYLAIDRVQHGRNSKRVLLVLSDGQDNNSHYFSKEVREVLKESDVLFYSIDVSDYSFSFGPTAQDILNELSAGSGGRAFRSGMSFDQRKTFNVGVTVAAPALELIAGELRNQYSLAIQPPAVRGTRSRSKLSPHRNR